MARKAKEIKTGTYERIPVTCPYCGVEMKSAAGLATHIRHKHKEINNDEVTSGKLDNTGNEPDDRTKNSTRTTDTDTEQHDLQSLPAKAPVSVHNKDEVIHTIQIIDTSHSTEGKAKNLVDEVGNFLFSENMAPVTMSILEAVAARLAGTQNNAQQTGSIVELVGGGKIKVPNPNF